MQSGPVSVLSGRCDMRRLGVVPIMVKELLEHERVAL